MSRRLAATLLSLALVAPILAGCASTAPTTATTDLHTTQPGRSSAKKPVSATTTPVPSPADVPSRSSLEAHREGVKPAPSPLKEIYFGFDRYDLTPEARAILRGNAGWLKANPAVRVEIEGHCDERGTNEYNLALGARRAQATKDYLFALGISPERMSTISYGEELPVCRERTEECYRLNRRSRFVILPPRTAS